MISARESASQLAALLAREHACLAEFLEALAAFDGRRGWEELGYTSLFWFLHRELKLSKGAALYRKTAADLIQAHPLVLEPLRDGRLCLSTVFEVAKVVSSENVSVVLPRFFHLSRKEAQAVVASIRPVETAPSRAVVTGVPVALPSPSMAALRHDTDVTVHPVDRNPRNVSPEPDAPTTPAQPYPHSRPPEVVPLDAELRRLHITVSKRLLAKLELARDALAHSHPMASMEAVLEAGLDLVIERHRKRRGVGAAPRARPRSAALERITADAKRRVWERDGGRCQWPIEGGGICASTLRLEIDHVVPRGMGGGSDAANLRLLCRFHNQRAARTAYGGAVMDRLAGRAPRAREAYAAYGPDR